MTETEEINALKMFVGRLNLTTIESYQPSDQGDGFFDFVLKTKCNGFFLKEFGDELYRLMDGVDQTMIENLKKKYFIGTKYSGVVTEEKGVVKLDPQIQENVDFVGTKNAKQSESVFIDVIKKVLRVGADGGITKEPQLKWIGKANQLGLIVSILSDLGLIETPKKGKEVNKQQLANLALGSFEIKAGLQNMRKSVDPDKNTMDKSEKVALSSQLIDTFKKLDELI